MKYLTTSKKDALRPIILRRDGSACIYCKNALISNPATKDQRTTFDHLDNNPQNNEIDNLCLVHWKCNQEKKHNAEYQVIAKQKLEENRAFDGTFDYLGVCVSQHPEPKQTSKELDINVAFFKITSDYIKEYLLNKGKPALEFNDTAYSVAYLMKDKTGHGSSATAKRYINELCSSVAPFKLENQDGIWFIVKRT